MVHKACSDVSRFTGKFDGSYLNAITMPENSGAARQRSHIKPSGRGGRCWYQAEVKITREPFCSRVHQQ